MKKEPEKPQEQLSEFDKVMRGVARLASSRGPQAQETSDRLSMKMNVVFASTFSLRFLVLRTQLEASWATQCEIFGRHRLGDL